MAKKNTAPAATQEVAAANTTSATEVATTNSAETTATPKAKRFIFRTPPMKKAPKASKPAKEKKGTHLTGVTINVATTTYNNWRSSAGDGTPENPGKWGLDELINGVDDNAPRKARFLRDEAAIVVDGVGQKYGGYISVAPAHVDEVVALLRKWDADNLAKPLGSTFADEASMMAAYNAGQVQLDDQFSMLEQFVQHTPPPRKERTKKDATASVSETAPAETTEVAA